MRLHGIHKSHNFALVKTTRDRAVVAHWAHNPEVVGSNPAPATRIDCLKYSGSLFLNRLKKKSRFYREESINLYFRSEAPLVDAPIMSREIAIYIY